MLWDRGNLALAGKRGFTREEVDGMFAAGEWVLLRHPTRPQQVYLVGPAPGTTGLIACVVQILDSPEGRRLRPIVAGRARRWHAERWHSRFTQKEHQR